MLCGDFALLGGQAVCDHLFPCGSWALLLVVLWVLPQLGRELPASWDGEHACEERAPVPFAPLGVGVGMGVLPAHLWGGVGGLLPQAQKFRDVWVVMAFRACLPVSLAFISGMQLFPR